MAINKKIDTQTNREKYLAEYDQQMNKNFPGQALEKQTISYFRCIAQTYFNNETDEAKVQEYLEQMIQDAKQKDTVLTLLKTLKTKYTPPPKVEEILNSEPTKRVKKQFKKPQKSQNEKKQSAKQEKVGQDEDQQTKKQGLKKQLENQGKQRCKFYPFCKNQQNCEYFHPSQKVINLSEASKQYNIKINT